jgi:hypothetical protein
MSRFVLNNKLTGKAHFELGPCPAFDLVPESGILPVPAVLEKRIGSEVALLLVDKTPFISTLAASGQFDLKLKTGAVCTSHGPLAFLLFWVPNPDRPDDVCFAHDYHLDPLDPDAVATWRDLARQSHWHVILVGADRTVLDVSEFENVFRLGEALDQMELATAGWGRGDFALARREFTDEYSLHDLFGL